MSGAVGGGVGGAADDLGPLRRALGGGGRFDYHIHVSTARRYVFFSNPKAGCSTVKATLNAAEARADGAAPRLDSMEAVHDRQSNPLLRPSDLGRREFAAMLADPAVFRFAFVRDPVARTLAAYRSKFRPGAAIWRRFARHIGWAGPGVIGFADFVDLIHADPRARDFDPHWRSQRLQIGYDHVRHDFIGRQETLDRDLGVVLARLYPGRAPEIFDARAAFGRTTGAAARAAALPAGLIAGIRAAYAADLDMIGEVDYRFGPP